MDYATLDRDLKSYLLALDNAGGRIDPKRLPKWIPDYYLPTATHQNIGRYWNILSVRGLVTVQPEVKNKFDPSFDQMPDEVALTGEGRATIKPIEAEIAEAKENSEAHDKLMALSEQLNRKYPTAKLSVGYIGNVSPRHDDRSYYVFSKIPKDGGPYTQSWGGYISYKKLWESIQNRLEANVQKALTGQGYPTMRFAALLHEASKLPQGSEARREILAQLKTAEPRYRDYVRRFKPKPGGPQKPMERAEWESKVLGRKPEDKKAPVEKKPTSKHPIPKKMYDYIGGKAPAIQKAIESGGPIKRSDAKAVVSLLEGALDKEESGKAAIDPTVRKHYKALVKFLKPHTKAPYTKTYAKPVTEVMDAHDLTDTDAGEVLKFKKDKPVGKKVSDAELLRRFLQKAKPETRERMKGVTPAEFMKMLGAIMDEEEGTSTGKKASLLVRLAKVATEHPEFRAQLMPLIREASQQKEAGTVQVYRRIQIVVRVNKQTTVPGTDMIAISGFMGIVMAGETKDVTPFAATLSLAEWGYAVEDFNFSRGPAVKQSAVLQLYRGALEEAINAGTLLRP